VTARVARVESGVALRFATAAATLFRDQKAPRVGFFFPDCPDVNSASVYVS